MLACLADIGYPPGDESLIPLREQVYDWLFSEKHLKSINTIKGLARMHASQEGNAIYSLAALGLADDRTDELVRRLLEKQWPDGGWNCDKAPTAHNSSFMETLIPLRGLSLYASLGGNTDTRIAVEREAEVFLKRRMFKKRSDGRIISESFVTLHCPCYWHYDILFGLKVMAEAGLIGDRRCSDALDLLESKQLSDGGFPAEEKYYQVTTRLRAGRSLVDWGGTSKRRMNEFVTTDVLSVLRASRRMATA